jgi:hypothetical protein
MSSGTFLGTVRASSWPALWDCAARYEFQTILGLRPPTQAPQRLGTAWHAATASFDRARMDGSPISIDDAAGVFVSELGKDSSSVQWTQPRKELESIGLSLTVRYCATLAPLRKYSAVELECSSLDVETPDGTIRLTGTTDRVRVDPDGKEGIGDLKSGKRAVGGVRIGKPRALVKAHALQLGVYQILAEHAAGRTFEGPAEIIGANASRTNPVIATARLLDVKRPLIGTPERPGLIALAARMFRSGSFPPNPSSQFCSARWCGGYSVCPYHSRDADPDGDNEPESL